MADDVSDRQPSLRRHSRTLAQATDPTVTAFGRQVLEPRLLETLRENDGPASVAHPLLPKRDCDRALEIRTGADDSRLLLARPRLHCLDELRCKSLALESICRAKSLNMNSAVGAVGEHF